MRQACRWVKAKRNTILVVALIAVLIAGAGLLQAAIDSVNGGSSGVSASGPSDAAHSILDLLGGVRQTLAAYLWSKTDDIHHEYYGGDISRETSLFPYYWLITRLDPHYAIAYYYASYMICALGQTQQGIDLALEGIRNNPDSSDLKENLASIYLLYGKDPAKAVYWFDQAIAQSTDPDAKRVWTYQRNLAQDVLEGKKPMPKPLLVKDFIKKEAQAAEKMEERQNSLNK